MVWPTRVRRRARKHAFEQAMDEVRLDPDGAPPLFEEPAAHNPGAARAVGGLGGIAVAAGYVAPASLKRAYGAEGDAEEARPAERPAEAARKLKAALEAGTLAPKDLKRLRRSYAADNHPDKLPPDLREEAVQAMAEVNAAIDRALKRAEAS